MARSVFFSSFVLCATLGCGACNQGSRHEDLVRPVAGRKPITAGLLVQMEGAGDYLLATELNRSEYRDHLVPLTHALAAFYGWPDPGRGIVWQSRFLDQLCRARFRKPCGSWRQAADVLQRRLFLDAAQLCPALFAKAPEGAEIPKDLCSKLNRLSVQTQKAVAAMARRWPIRSLYAVKRCEYQPVSAVVVEVGPDRLWVNGLDVVPLTLGRPPADPDLPAALQSMLAAGAAVVQARVLLSDEPGAQAAGSGNVLVKDAGGAKSPTGSNAPDSHSGPKREGGEESGPGRLLLRVRRGVPWSTLSWVVSLAASVNLTKVSFRVRDQQDRPCRIAARVSTLPLPPSGAKIVLGHGKSLDLCMVGRCVTVTRSDLFRRLGCGKGGCRRPWFLRVETDDFAQVVQFLAQLPDGIDAPLLWLPGTLSRSGRARKKGCLFGHPCRPGQGSSRRVQPGSQRGLVPRR